MKKFLTFIFTILSAFVVFALTLSLNAGAESTSGIAMTEGAQVRTASGEDAKQGIKFTASVTEFPEGSTHGFLVAKGEYTAAEMRAMFTAGDETVKDVPVTGTNNTFSVVLYGVPEEAYLQDITVIAYVVLSDGVTVEDSSTEVTRNLAEVAIYNANGDLANNALINSVVTALNDDYRKVITHANGDISVVGLNTNNLAVLEELFVADVNAFVGEEILTVDSTAYDYYWNFTSDSKDDLSEARPYLFFNDETYGARWKWILEWMNEVVSTTQDAGNAAVQIEAILNKTPVYDSTVHVGVDGLFLGRHAVNAIYNFFNATNEDYGGYPTYHFDTVTSLDGYEDYNNVAYFQLEDVQAVDESITIPAAQIKDGYTSKWTLNGSDFSGSTYALTSEEASFATVYTVVDYTVKFYSGEDSLDDLTTTYNIEKSLTLPTFVEGLNLEGWYESSDFSGDPVTSIALGNTGNKVFYAKVAEKVATYVVDQTLDSTNNTVEVGGVTYTLGTDAFTSITDALAVAVKDDSIYLVAGTYDEDFTISTNNIKILGPNYNKSGNATDRADEAILTGSITLTAKQEGKKFYGLKFTGDAQISNEMVSSLYQDSFEFVNNVVESTLASGSFLNFNYAGNTTYSENNIISNNKFTSTTANTSEFLSFGDSSWTTITNNTFTNIGGTAIYFDDTERGLVNGATISNNTFTNVLGVVIAIDWFGNTNAYSGSALTVFEICNNTFTGTGNVNINLGNCNNSTRVSSFTITGNTWSVDKSTSLVLPSKFTTTCITTINVQSE